MFLKDFFYHLQLETFKLRKLSRGVGSNSNFGSGLVFFPPFDLIFQKSLPRVQTGYTVSAVLFILLSSQSALFLC